MGAVGFFVQTKLNGKLLHLPNRDYPFEGLMVHHDGENWKFIDCIGLGMQRQDGSYVPLENLPTIEAVRLNPWLMTYYYKTPSWAGDLPVTVSYYLNSINSPTLTSGCIEFCFPNGRKVGDEYLTPVIEPFIDLRHMFYPGNLNGYEVQMDEADETQRVHLSCYNRTLSFYFKNASLELFRSPEILHWNYKLGTGSRIETNLPIPSTNFIGEEKDVAGWFCLRPHLAPASNLFHLFFGCGLNKTSLEFSNEDIQKFFLQSKEKDRSDFYVLEKSFPCSGGLAVQTAIHARIAGLVKFKTYVRLEKEHSWVKVPHAGAWWFKTPWYRDVFEGLL